MESSRTHKLPRRRFLGALAASTAVGAAPAVLRARTVDAAEKVVVAVMGTNGRGTGLARGFAALPDAEVACVCDVDPRAVDKAARAVGERQQRPCSRAGDFRRVLDDKGVDALVIAAPNHWHAPAAIRACAAGKHVYVEKPCSHTAREGELLVEAARRHERVVQMGNQRRSWDKVVEGIRLVQSGGIGRAYYSLGWYFNSRGATGKATPASVPSWLDWDLWQGPAPRRPYRENLVHYKWHWFWHWGNGELGNNGVHALDLCRWGLEVDYPERVVSSGGRYHFDDDQETPDTHVVSFEFPGRRQIKWEGTSCHGRRLEEAGIASFHGDGGSVVIKGTGYDLYDSQGKLQKSVSGAGGDETHLANFVDCVRSGQRPNSDIAGGHKSTLLCHLGNIAQRTGRVLRCEPTTGRIVGDTGAQAAWEREYEPGWEPKIG